MKPIDIVLDKNISNRDKFGVYLRERRLELGMSLRYFSGLLSLTPAYISDIESGNRLAPIKSLEKIIDILKIEKEDINAFYDLAGCTHGNWQDINEYLVKTPNARKFLRLAKDKNLSDEELSTIIYNMIDKSKELEK